MIELRFHQELYDGFAVDEAASVYAEYASMDRERDPNGYIVRVTARPEALEKGISERDIGAELMNYALGKTIERGASAEVASLDAAAIMIDPAGGASDADSSAERGLQ